jgi:hypothetical protein
MSLSHLRLQDNPLPQEAYDTHIPQIIANNPQILIEHDHHAGRYLSISSTVGGSVIDPGEGVLTYEYHASVRIEAQAMPGFVFVGWSGTFSSTQNPAFVNMNCDHTIKATFASQLATLYVDHDAVPKDPNSDDSRRDGTQEHPIARIQDAIDVAMDGATIVVRPGVYRENINLLGKKIHLVAIDPADPHAGPCAVIEGAGTGPVVRIGFGGCSDCSLTGFVITKGRGSPAGGVYCSSSSPTLRNCLIVGNRCPDPEGGALYFDNSKAVLINCTIADNYGGPDGAALMLVDSDITMTDSIVWGNRPNEISPKGTSGPVIQYCCVRGWWCDIGNTHADPFFVRRGHWVSPTNPSQVLGWEDSQAVWIAGDYHLQSQAGRWEPMAGQWVHDDVTSPAIDAGDPAGAVGHESLPHGGRINMGAYGGTTEASRSF